MGTAIVVQGDPGTANADYFSVRMPNLVSNVDAVCPGYPKTTGVIRGKCR